MSTMNNVTATTTAPMVVAPTTTPAAAANALLCSKTVCVSAHLFDGMDDEMQGILGATAFILIVAVLFLLIGCCCCAPKQRPYDPVSSDGNV